MQRNNESAALLVLTTSYPIESDGSEAAGAFVADLVAELSTQLPVYVIAPGLQEGLEVSIGQVKIRRFASSGRPLSLLSPANPLHWIAIIRTLFSMRKQALLAVSESNISHTLALWALPSGWVAKAIKKQKGVPYSIWALGSDIWSLGQMPLINRVLTSVALNARYRYADGYQLATDAQAISSHPFDFLPSTRRLDDLVERIYSNEPPYRLLFLGRWHRNKGVDLLLEALSKLSTDDWSRITQIRIAGGGPLDGVVRSVVGELQAIGRPIILDGYLNRQAASVALAEADYLLLPSRVESIPVVFSDALKAGLPVISTPVGDLPILISGDEMSCGILSQEVSSNSYAIALSKALTIPPIQFSEGIRLVREQFDLKSIANRILATVQDA